MGTHPLHIHSCSDLFLKSSAQLLNPRPLFKGALHASAPLRFAAAHQVWSKWANTVDSSFITEAKSWCRFSISLKLAQRLFAPPLSGVRRGPGSQAIAPKLVDEAKPPYQGVRRANRPWRNAFGNVCDYAWEPVSHTIFAQLVFPPIKRKWHHASLATWTAAITKRTTGV